MASLKSKAKAMSETSTPQITIPQPYEQCPDEMSDVLIHTKSWRKQAEEKLPSYPWALRVIKQQLWCCVSLKGITIYSSDLKHERSMPCSDMGGVYDVAEMSRGDIVIATNRGLYHTDTDGEIYDCPRRLVSDYICVYVYIGT